jgi:hypothetical protein
MATILFLATRMAAKTRMATVVCQISAVASSSANENKQLIHAHFLRKRNSK